MAQGPLAVASDFADTMAHVVTIHAPTDLLRRLP